MMRPMLMTTVLLLASCGGGNDTAEGDAAENIAPTHETQLQAGELNASEARAAEEREFTAIELDAMRPAFAEDTVIKLNAIVRRSLNTANEFTSSVRAIRASVNAAAGEQATEAMKAEALRGIDQINGWHNRALNAQTDMDTAVGELKASSEIYNEEILAGMVKYVNDVERMLRDEGQALSDRLDAANRN